MRVHVDADGPVPPFEQIRAQLAAMIGGGALPAGHRLPSIRQLAADLDVASAGRWSHRAERCDERAR
jgi:DNA-binding transcriptional regulator YhcF (GntR family)